MEKSIVWINLNTIIMFYETREKNLLENCIYMPWEKEKSVFPCFIPYILHSFFSLLLSSVHTARANKIGCLFRSFQVNLHDYTVCEPIRAKKGRTKENINAKE